MLIVTSPSLSMVPGLTRPSTPRPLNLSARRPDGPVDVAADIHGHIISQAPAYASRFQHLVQVGWLPIVDRQTPHHACRLTSSMQHEPHAVTKSNPEHPCRGSRLRQCTRMTLTWGWRHHPVSCPVGVLAQHSLALLQHNAAPKATVQAGAVHHNGIFDIVPCKQDSTAQPHMLNIQLRLHQMPTGSVPWPAQTATWYAQKPICLLPLYWHDTGRAIRLQEPEW